ncbi:MFS transporter [Breznakia pachnodae]|uniref:MFS family permease n=1 Tax=Breznakia pachnodae TaxID=265178 RepID=A0ABU0DZT6_9FIRM|nr:MFS transporter [Breznakia pachnodae]MDQ0359961.1 MFS family permease [Breznakia pachnodae]
MEQTINRKTLFQTQKQYTKYMAANLINRFGDSLDAIATSWLIYQVTGDASMSAITLVFNYLPTILFTPFLGALVEKLNKKYVMSIVDFLRGCIVLFYAFGYVNGLLNAPIILALTFTISTIEAFGEPAVSSFIPSILEEEYYEIGIGTNRSLCGVMELIGAGCAGFIVSFFGILGAFLVDAATFLLASFIKLTIKYKDKSNGTTQNEAYLTLLKDGFKYLRKSKVLVFFCCVAVILNSLLVPYNAFIAAYISEYLNNNASYLSIFSVSISIGAILGGYIYPFVAKKLSIPAQLSMAAVASAVAYIAIYLFPILSIPTFVGVGIIVASLLFLGMSIGVASSALSVTFMKQIEHEYLARTSAIFSSAAIFGMPFTSFLLSILIRFTGILYVFLIFAIFCVFIFVILKRNKTID